MIVYFPDEQSIIDARMVDDPILVLISHDGETVILGNIDTYGEHLILLKHAGYDERRLDDFYRIVATSTGADWTFVAPSGYKGIQNRELRIKTFYNDGVSGILKVLRELEFSPDIQIPTRYRRHLDIFKD